MNMSGIPDVQGGMGITPSRTRDDMRTIISRADGEAAVHLSKSLHAADLADMLESLDSHERAEFVRLCGDQFDLLVLKEIDDVLRSEILGLLSIDGIARGIGCLDTNDALRVLEGLSEEGRAAVIALLPNSISRRLLRGFSYPEKTAGRRMQTNFIALPPHWTVGQTLEYLRDMPELPENFYELFMVDEAFRPVGIVPLDRLVRAKEPIRIDTIADKKIYKASVSLDQEEVAQMFKRYGFASAVVTDNSGRLVGITRVDDVINVIEEEANEDLQRLGGISEKSLSGWIPGTASNRFSWLFVNLLTAILASWVINLFDAELERMVALAVLMPIVASMAGNAGTQTMTVTVRALASDGWERFNVKRSIIREGAVSLLNGAVFAVMLGTVAVFWFAEIHLGIIIGFSMIVSLAFAGISGLFVPLILNRLKFDPAIASGVLVTAITDVIGFFSFLGFAALWMNSF